MYARTITAVLTVAVAVAVAVDVAVDVDVAVAVDVDVAVAVTIAIVLHEEIHFFFCIGFLFISFPLISLILFHRIFICNITQDQSRI